MLMQERAKTTQSEARPILHAGAPPLECWVRASPNEVAADEHALRANEDGGAGAGRPTTLDVPAGTRVTKDERLVLPTLVQPTVLRRQEKLDRLVSLLRQDARMPITTMSRKTGLPCSTIHDLLKRVEEHYVISVTFIRKHADADGGWKQQRGSNWKQQQLATEEGGAPFPFFFSSTPCPQGMRRISSTVVCSTEVWNARSCQEAA